MTTRNKNEVSSGPSHYVGIGASAGGLEAIKEQQGSIQLNVTPIKATSIPRTHLFPPD